MPTLPTDNTKQFSPETQAQALESLIGALKASEVRNVLFEQKDGGETAAVFATTDPAVINVLQGLLMECDDLSNFYQ